MSKKLVLQILNECVEVQERANAGGIIGGKENEDFAKKDLARFIKARDWFKKNHCK